MPLIKLWLRKINEDSGEALRKLLGILPERSLWSRYKASSDGRLPKAGSLPVSLGPGFDDLSAEKSVKAGSDPSSEGIDPENKLSDSTVTEC